LPQGSYFQFERRGFYFVDSIAMVNKKLVVNFVPDGKTKGMSVISHTVDANETAKGKTGEKDGKKDKKQAGGAGPDGKLSKKELKKLEKKAAKKGGKTGDAAA